MVQWPTDRLWWRWAQSNAFRVHAIHEKSMLDAEMEPWNEICLSWSEFVGSDRWKAALRQWRGIYYIFDTKRRARYVGSVYGEENIFGRWFNYAASGHGGSQETERIEQCAPPGGLCVVVPPLCAG